MTHSFPLRLSRKSHPAHGRPRYKGHDARLMGAAQRHYRKHTTTRNDDNTNNNNARTTASQCPQSWVEMDGDEKENGWRGMERGWREGEREENVEKR